MCRASQRSTAQPGSLPAHRSPGPRDEYHLNSFHLKRLHCSSFNGSEAQRHAAKLRSSRAHQFIYFFTNMKSRSSAGGAGDGTVIGLLLVSISTSFFAPYGASVSDIAHILQVLIERIYVVGVLAYLSVLFYNQHRQSSRINEGAELYDRDELRVADDGSYVVVSPPESLDADADEEEEDGDIVNLSGTFKLAKNVDFDKFLEAQGVGWALRSAANKARPVHKITHRGRTLRIQITGIITGDTTYQIGGPPVTSQIRDRVFSDTVQYLDSGDGIRVQKKCLSGGTGKIFVTRRLSRCGSELTMRSKCVFEDGRESAEAVQTFERIS